MPISPCDRSSSAPDRVILDIAHNEVPSLAFISPEGKAYKLNDKIATLLVRPRGWHLPEKHLRADGKPISGSLAHQWGLPPIASATPSGFPRRTRNTTASPSPGLSQVRPCTSLS